MDRNYFLNAGMPPPLHFEPSLSPSPMPTWRSLNSVPEMISRQELSSERFLQPNWEKSTDQYTQFESALSSMVSSPVASNSAVSNDSFVIRELIGKLGNICNTGDISPQFLAAMGGGKNSNNNSCYSTPLNSPPKLNMPIMDQFIKENVPNLGNSMPLNPNLPSLAADPGFAERAAKFSCFGSRSFNGRSSQLGLNNPEFQFRSSVPVIGNSRLPRVSSSPSLKIDGSPVAMAVQENRNLARGQNPMEIGSGNGSILESDKKLSKLSGSTANSNEESSVSEQIQIGETGLKSQNDSNSRKRKAASRGKAKENASAKKEAEATDDSNAKRLKNSEGQDNGGVKTEEETKGGDNEGGDEAKKPEPPKDYIHVRARRGQATDSHSLAERVRREKISERMKLLQDLVPGCNKVTGKALMLDEIINYVQSLQRQVEFLSMKLATVNPRLDFDMNSLLSKDVNQSNGNLPHQLYPLESSATAFLGQQPRHNPQVHNNTFNGSVDPMAPVHGFGEGLSQFPAFSEDDLQSIVQMGFGDNLARDTQFNPHMKLEL